jgi:hypothetical protein
MQTPLGITNAPSDHPDFVASLDKRDRTKLPTFARSSSPGIEKRWSRTSPVDVGRVQLVRNFNFVGFENFGFVMFAYLHPYAKPQFDYRSANIELCPVCSDVASREAGDGISK